MAANRGANTPPGPGIDASGQSVVDPSTNVRALNDASVRRLDDMAALRAEMSQRDNDALRREMGLRASYEGQLAEKDDRLADKETQRLDAIRMNDVATGQRTADVQAATALSLAAQVATSAEALRGSQAQATSLADTKLVTALEPIQKRIDDLSRAQYEAQGQKTQVVETRSAAEDMKPVIDAIERLTAAQNLSLGGQAQVVETRAKSSNVNLWIGLAIGAAGLVFAGFSVLISLAVAVFVFAH